MNGDAATPVCELVMKALPRNEGREKLREAMRCWPSIVVLPALARGSSPYDLVGGTLYVAAKSPHAKQRLEQMRGNIQRGLREKCGLEVSELRVSLTAAPPIPLTRPPARPLPRPPRLEPDEGRVRALQEACPSGLPSDAALALARLRAFFERRFSNESRRER